MSLRSIAGPILLASLPLVGAACAPLPASESPASEPTPGVATSSEAGAISAPQALPGASAATLLAPPQPPESVKPPPAPSSPPPPTSIATPAPEEDDGTIDYEERGDLSYGHRVVLRIVARCYVRALDRGERSVGALFVELMLEPSGKVRGVTMADGFSRGVTTCAEPKLRELQFAPGDGRLGLLRIPIQELSAEEVDASH
jgi:hypothetical protein